MKDGRMIFEFGIQKEATIHAILRLRGGDRSIKESLGLINIAQAIALWNWDGIMPGPVSHVI